MGFIVVGTSHFESFDAAVDYYKGYGYSPDNVADKIDLGEISVGKPVLSPGQVCYLDREERRYYVRRSE